MTTEQKLSHIKRLQAEAEALEAKATQKREQAERLRDSINEFGEFGWGRTASYCYTCQALKNGELHKVELFTPFKSLTVIMHSKPILLPNAGTTREADFILLRHGFVPKKY